VDDEVYYENPEEMSNDDSATADCEGLCFARQLEEMAEIIKDGEEKVFRISNFICILSFFFYFVERFGSCEKF
jgi:hypothetical protein